jgi:hypothetical protein
LRPIGHPNPHGGVHGKVADASESLTFAERRNWNLRKLKIAGSENAFGAILQTELAVYRRHSKTGGRLEGNIFV